MAFERPPLKYAEDALAPHISKETVSYHYGKHTKKYFDTVNEMIKGTVYENKATLSDLITKDTMVAMEAKLFNNACQAWNHQFYWACLTPADKSGEPSDDLMDQIEEDFGTFEEFKKKFGDLGDKQFGSGWAWLIWKDGKLIVKATPNGKNPLTDQGQTPLLTMDVWEHAYYLDYMNERPAYIKAFWNVVNWDYVSAQFAKAKK